MNNVLTAGVGTVSTLLPPLARAVLIRAVQIDPDLAPGESPARSRALEGEIRRLKVHYPQFFK